MMELTLAILKGKNGNLIGKIKEIPAVISQGKNEQELRENILDAINLYLEDMRDENEYITDKKFIKEEPFFCA